MRGAKVTVVETQPRLLMRGVPAEIAEVISARHRARRGVSGSLHRFGACQLLARRALTDHGDCRHRRRARIRIWLPHAGLDIDNGIAVTRRCDTSDSDIFAAGDCCSFPLALYGGSRVRLEMLAQRREQGALAARNMLGANETVSGSAVVLVRPV